MEAKTMEEYNLALLEKFKTAQMKDKGNILLQHEITAMEVNPASGKLQFLIGNITYLETDSSTGKTFEKKELARWDTLGRCLKPTRIIDNKPSRLGGADLVIIQPI